MTDGCFAARTRSHHADAEHPDKMAAAPSTLRAAESESCLYPPIDPFKTGIIEVGVHKIYWEACGTPTGKPVVILHGGPGAGCRNMCRKTVYFTAQDCLSTGAFLNTG